MLIFLAMLVPFITAIVLWFKFQHKTKWWEFFIPFGGSFVFALLMHFTTSFFQASRDEYWTGWITKASYTEAWNEKVYYNVRVADGTEKYTGSDGKRHSRTKYKTVRKSRIDEHPPSWSACGSNGESYSISSSEYKDFVRRWGNESFEELNRNFYNKDGDRYNVLFNNRNEDMEVISSVHSYENKVAVSRSVFKLQPVKEEDVKRLGLYDYPSIVDKWVIPSVLGDNVPGFAQAERRLSVFNARYGASKELRVWLLVFKEQTLDAGYAQQNYWINGNMNELVICVGVDKDYKVTWGHAFSWCDNSEINVQGRNIVNDQIGKRVELDSILDWIEEAVPTFWKRKEFEKDFDYLDVAPPTWAVILTFLFTIGLNVGISYWIVNNEFHEPSIYPRKFPGFNR